MYSTGITENNKSPKKLSEYNHYANKSLVFSIIGLLLPIVFWIVVLNTLQFFMRYPLLNLTFIVVGIVCLTLLILGIIFGKKGLKSNKHGTSVAGLVLSIMGLSIPFLGILILLIYFLAGGEIM
jgi:hypothetical protein